MEYYAHAKSILQNWMETCDPIYKSDCQYLIDNTLELKQGIENTKIFGILLTELDEDNLTCLMYLLFEYIRDPNIILESGVYKGKSLLQGLIAI